MKPHADSEPHRTAASAVGTGWVNAHTHIYSGLVPLGMPAPVPRPKSFVEILERVWWRLDRALDAPALRAAARYYVAEALLHGTTVLVDHHESPRCIEGSLDILADACDELGMRALLCYGATERNFGRDEAKRGLAECRRFIVANTRPHVRGLVGLHASFTVSDQVLRAAGELAAELRTVVHVHVAEDRADVADAQRHGYAGPLERLLDHSTLLPGSILAHGVCLDESQVAMADHHGLWLVQNPRSNTANRVGHARNLWASHRVALGTDGFPSDMECEREALERLEGIVLGGADGAAVAACRLEGGTRLVAECPGEALEVGGDWVEMAEPDGGSHLARHVRVAGRDVVVDGNLVTADLGEIRWLAEQHAARLWKRMAEIP